MDHESIWYQNQNCFDCFPAIFHPRQLFGTTRNQGAVVSCGAQQEWAHSAGHINLLSMQADREPSCSCLVAFFMIYHKGRAQARALAWESARLSEVIHGPCSPYWSVWGQWGVCWGFEAFSLTSTQACLTHFESQQPKPPPASWESQHQISSIFSAVFSLISWTYGFNNYRTNYWGAICYLLVLWKNPFSSFLNMHPF